MKTTSMHITMNGIRIYAFHGVDPQENIVGAYFTINLKIKCDFSEAAISDELENTISYADIYNKVKEEMSVPSKLLENVCQRICSKLFDSFDKIEEIEISLFKENPPMNAQAKDIGVEVKYVRN